MHPDSVDDSRAKNELIRPRLSKGSVVFGVLVTAATLGLAAARMWSSGMFEVDADAVDEPLPITVAAPKPKPAAPRPKLVDRAKRGAFPAIVDRQAASNAAISTPLRDEDFVIGVELNGEARAYALNSMTTPAQHIVNDTLGGVPIAVTWCDVCESPLVFSRKVADRVLTFVVLGKQLNDNMIMVDLETNTTWVQLIGEGEGGALSGASLDQIAAIWTDWKTWRRAHPDTTTIELTRTTEKFSHSPDYMNSPSERARFAELQWGLTRGDVTYSWPFIELAQQQVVNDLFGEQPVLIFFDVRDCTVTAFDRRVDNKTLTFQLRGGAPVDLETGSLWDPITGRALSGPLTGSRLEPVAGTISKIRTWNVFHPRGVVRAAHGV